MTSVETVAITDLVDRERELEALGARLAAATSGTGHTVLVSGEAGIGKTSLAKQLAADHPEVMLWWGACDALQTPHPLAPLHDIARSANVRFGPLLASATHRTALFEAVVQELRAAPTLMVIEDAHWADESTLDLIRFVGRRIDRVPALLLVTFRDDEVSASHPLRKAIGDLSPSLMTRMALRRLSREGVEALARRALRSPGNLYSATQGNPFFVTELLRQGGQGVPQSVEDLVLARFARLTPNAQEIVRLVSIVPARAERWLVEEILHPGTADLDACLDSGLLLADPESLSFRHELARVAIEKSLSPPKARSLHAAALACLGPRPHNVASAARRVHHAAHAGDANAVSELAPVAAEQALERGAHREGAAHYRTALEFVRDDEPSRARLLEAYAVECQVTSQLNEAIEARQEIAAIRKRQGDVLGEAVNLSQLAVVFVLGLKNAKADAASRRAIALLETLPPGLPLASAYRVEAQLRMLNRDCRESAEWSRKALDLAHRLGDTPLLAAAQCTLGAAYLFIDYEESVRHLQRALEIALPNGLHYVAANTYTNLGSGSGELFKLDAADRYLREAIEYSTRHEVDFYRYYGLAWLALCDVLRGRWDDAAAHADEVISGSSEANTARIMALCAVGRLRCRRGDPGGEAALDEALALASLTGTLQRVGPVRAARAEAAYARGDLAGTAAEARAALDLALRHDHPWIAGELSFWLWRAGAADWPPGICAEPFRMQIAGGWREAADAWKEIGCPFERARALADGDGEAQLEALALFEELGAAPSADALRSRLRAAGVRGVPRGARASTRGNPQGLTTREMEVLGLLCEGLKNSEIAERLFRSVRTIDHHLDAILAKLGARSRAEAVAAAHRLGIVRPK